MILLLELVTALVSIFVGLVGGLIGAGLLGGGEYGWFLIVLLLPLGLLGLGLALLYAFFRPRFAKPLRWSLLTASLGALLILGWLLLAGARFDLESLGYALLFILPPPLLQALGSGGMAARRQRRAA